MMPIRFLLDEAFRDEAYRNAIQKHNAGSPYKLDVLRVGDGTPAPDLQTTDSVLLQWASDSGRVIITFDKNTMPMHLARFLEDGNTSPGVIIFRRHTIPQLIEWLCLVAYAVEPGELANRVTYLPK